MIFYVCFSVSELNQHLVQKCVHLYEVTFFFLFSDKFLAFSGPHNKSRIENGKTATTNTQHLQLFV